MEKVIEVACETSSGETLDFRIEIFSKLDSASKAKRFKARLFRYETFKVEPAFEADCEFKNAMHTWAIWEPDVDIPVEAVIEPDEAAAWFLKHLSTRLGVPFKDD